MSKPKKPDVPPAAKAPQDEAPAAPVEEVRGRIIERPDGFYWQAKAGGEEYGPFVTLADAEADMQSSGNELEPGETLQEAESEIGVAEWIDPDTGDPAEDSVPRIEDH